MIPDFELELGGSDRTEVVRSLLESISVVDKPGIEADTCDITLKSEDMLATPERGTEVKVKLGFRGAGLSEVFSGVANQGRHIWSTRPAVYPSDRDSPLGR